VALRPGPPRHPGNERADEIANAFAAGKRPTLYRGPLIRYDVPIMDIPDDTSVPWPGPERRRRAPWNARTPI